MSILIRGMKMPKSCNDCPCIDLDNDKYECAACGILKKPLPWKWANSHGIDVIYLRPIDCPLIEMPTPHGQLIDIEPFMRGLYEEIQMGQITYTSQELYDMIDEEIKSMPIIIESEE